jgi:hypothetical protein
MISVARRPYKALVRCCRWRLTRLDERAAAIETAYGILCQLMRRRCPRHLLEEVFRECGLTE